MEDAVVMNGEDSGSEMEILIVSPGGMGSSYVLEQFAAGYRTNEAGDFDGLKHAPTPYDSRLPAGELKVVYVWNDPLMAILSLNRRGWLNIQCRKLEGWASASKNLPRLWNFTEKFGSDVYGLEEHAKCWLTTTRWPIFFYDIRSSTESDTALGRFIGREAPRLEFRARKTPDPVHVPETVVKVYARLDESVRELGKICNKRNDR